jgi:hypothetical protein
MFGGFIGAIGETTATSFISFDGSPFGLLLVAVLVVPVMVIVASSVRSTPGRRINRYKRRILSAVMAPAHPWAPM